MVVFDREKYREKERKKARERKKKESERERKRKKRVRESVRQCANDNVVKVVVWERKRGKELQVPWVKKPARDI